MSSNTEEERKLATAKASLSAVSDGVLDYGAKEDLDVAMLASYGHHLAAGGILGRAAAAVPYIEGDEDVVSFDDGVRVPSGLAAIKALDAEHNRMLKAIKALDAEHNRMLKEVVVRIVAEMSGPGQSLRAALRNLADNPKFESFWKQLEPAAPSGDAE